MAVFNFFLLVFNVFGKGIGKHMNISLFVI